VEVAQLVAQIESGFTRKEKRAELAFLLPPAPSALPALSPPLEPISIDKTSENSFRAYFTRFQFIARNMHGKGSVIDWNAVLTGKHRVALGWPRKAWN
jgi:hypothetical protein